MADFQFSFNVNCSQHHAIPVTHACTLISCKHNLLLCTSCLLENLEHAQDHKEYMVPMNHFSNKFFKNIQEIKTKLLPFQDILRCKEDHLAYYSKFIRAQKAAIEKELSSLQEQLNFFMDKLKMASFKELDENHKYLTQQYDKLEECFSIPELKFINVQNEHELNEKINNFPKNKVETFLMNLRLKIFQLIDPKGHSVYGNVNDICSEIHNFRKQDTPPLSFNTLSSKYLKPFFAEVESIVSNFISSLSQLPRSYRESLANDFSQQNDQEMLKKKRERSVSPKPKDLQNQKEEEFAFPKSQVNRNQSFKILQTNGKSVLLSTSQISKEINATKIANLDFDYNVPCLTFLPLEKNIFLLSLANNELMLGKVEENRSINAIVNFKIHNDNSNFNALTKLTPQGTDGIYFAAGNDKGNIYIWKAESVMGPGSDSKPMAALMASSESEGISCLLEAGNGSHLLAGTTKGSIALWDYMMGSLVKKYQAHSGAVNGFNLFNGGNGLVSSSTEGLLTFWTIQRERRVNDFEEVTLVLSKKLPTESSINCIGSMLTFDQGTIVCDENGSMSLLDNVKFRARATLEVGEEFVLDFVTIEGNSGNSKEKAGLLIAFTKSRILFVDINTFEILKVLNSKNTNIPLFLNPSAIGKPKVGIVGCVGSEILIAVSDQRNNSPTIVSVFSVSV